MYIVSTHVLLFVKFFSLLYSRIKRRWFSSKEEVKGKRTRRIAEMPKIMEQGGQSIVKSMAPIT